MVSRLCLEPKCQLFAVDGRRCSRHAAAFEAARGDWRSQYNEPAYRRTRTHLLRSGAPCAACGTTEDLTVDHIIPLSRGGTNHPGNLQVLCRRCNAKKGSDEHRTGTRPGHHRLSDPRTG